MTGGIRGRQGGGVIILTRIFGILGFSGSDGEGDAGFAPADCRVGAGAKGVGAGVNAVLRFRGCGHIAMPLQPSFRLSPTTVMEPASIDSGLRRNDGWGSRNDGEYDHTP